MDAKNKPYGQFRENKRKEVISLLEKGSKSIIPSKLTKKMTRDIDDDSFHAVNWKNFPTDRDIMHDIFRELKKKNTDLGLTNDTLQNVMISSYVIDEKDLNKRREING